MRVCIAIFATLFLTCCFGLDLSQANRCRDDDDCILGLCRDNHCVALDTEGQDAGPSDVHPSEASASDTRQTDGFNADIIVADTDSDTHGADSLVCDNGIGDLRCSSDRADDDVAPGAPEFFSAIPNNASVTLTWNNPVDADFASVIIRRSQLAFPTDPNAGQLVCAACISPHEDSDLSNGVVYYYSAWAFDCVGNVSLAVHQQVVPADLWGDNSIQQAYIKASNTDADDLFGSAVAMSADGNTLVVGAANEQSASSGVGSAQTSNSADRSGAVYVFDRVGSQWSQRVYIKASNTDRDDNFGLVMALSADGNTLAVAAPKEDSCAIGIDNDGTNNGCDDAGAVYVFFRQGPSWSQQAYIKASNTDAGDVFGGALALSGDGTTLAVAATGEDGDGTSSNADPNNSASNAGAVYLFVRSGALWSQQALLKASNAEWGDEFGSAVALNGDGSTLVIGAAHEDSSATGVNASEDDNAAQWSGAAYVFIRVEATWSQQAYIKASNTDAYDYFAEAVSLSGDGSRLVIGARGEDSGVCVANSGAEGDNSKTDVGAVYLFFFQAKQWQQRAYIKSHNCGQTHLFGRTVSLSDAGDVLAVGAPGEKELISGINPETTGYHGLNYGAAYVFAIDDLASTQRVYIKPSNTTNLNYFASALALSGDANTLVVGAYVENSAARGVDGDQLDDSADASGAAYVFVK